MLRFLASNTYLNSCISFGRTALCPLKNPLLYYIFTQNLATEVQMFSMSHILFLFFFCPDLLHIQSRQSCVLLTCMAFTQSGLKQMQSLFTGEIYHFIFLLSSSVKVYTYTPHQKYWKSGATSWV